MNPMRVGIAVTLCASAAVWVATAAPDARADDQSYLAALDAQGLLGSTPAYSRLETGQKFCNEMRHGSSPDEVAARYQNLPTYGGWSGWSMLDDLRMQLHPVIATAARELCPDTLR